MFILDFSRINLESNEALGNNAVYELTSKLIVAAHKIRHVPDA